MAYRTEKTTTGNAIVIDGWENGIAPSPYKGIANIRNMGTSYYPGVAYVNYRRQSTNINAVEWFAGTHSTNVSDNLGWTFTAPTSATMTNPVSKAISPVGLIYILDDSGQIFKQSAVNSAIFNELGNGSGRKGNGSGGLAYFNNYLVVFGAGFIEFCGKGTTDADITSSNWNLNNSGNAANTSAFATNFGSNSHNLILVTSLATLPRFNVNDPIQFTTTGTLPAGLSLNTTYYILTSDGANTITVSTSVGGSAVTLTSDGTGVHTITDYSTPLPLGNCTSFVATGLSVGGTTMTISSYVNPSGVTVNNNWQEATGLYKIIMTDGQALPANFTNGSATINLLSPLIYYAAGSNWQVQLLDTTVTNYNPYVSKVDGSLLYANGQFLGRIAESTSPNISFNPGLAITYNVSYGVTALPEQNQDTIVMMTDLKDNLVVAGQKDVYTWDYLSAATSSPSPVGEKIFKIINLLSNIYILAGQKGNIYTSNGYSAQLFYKVPDFIAGVIDPVWSWGDIMVHRSKLFFQLLAQNTAGTNILSGIFSLIASPSMTGEVASGMVMESQNSYGLTPVSGTPSNGLLIDNSPSANGNDSYYSAWSNGSASGGIDYNDTTLWQNSEPIIETDIIPIGDVLNQQTFGNIEFKLDRPMATGDLISLYWRPSLSDAYALIGTTTTAVLSDYKESKVVESQWAQFKVVSSCASSGSSRVPVREVRLHFN